MESDSSSSYYDDYYYEGGAEDVKINSGMLKTTGPKDKESQLRDLFIQAAAVYEKIFNKLMKEKSQYKNIISKMVQFNSSVQLFNVFVSQTKYNALKLVNDEELKSLCSKMREFNNQLPEIESITAMLLRIQNKAATANINTIVSKFSKNNASVSQQVLNEVLKSSTASSNIQILDIQRQVQKEK